MGFKVNRVMKSAKDATRVMRRAIERGKPTSK